MATLQDPKVREFLSQGTRTGLLGFTAADGRPLVAPVWFVVDGDVLVFNTGKDSAKGRSVLRDPRLALCVDLPHPPYAFVQVQGTAEVSEDPQDLVDTATMIAARYVGPDEAEEFGRRNGVPGELAIRLHPTKINAAFDMTA
jgi:PPOX class probable F420-dependent enzyme